MSPSNQFVPEAIRRSLVGIVVSKDKTRFVTGAGLLLTGNRVLTCAHVVRGLELVAVRFPYFDGPEQRAKVSQLLDGQDSGPLDVGATMASAPERDLAILTLIDPLPVEAEPAKFSVGPPPEAIRLIGFPETRPEDLPVRWTEMALKTAQLESSLETRAVIRKGYSGGPIYCSKIGHVFGIASCGRLNPSLASAVAIGARILFDCLGPELIPLAPRIEVQARLEGYRNELANLPLDPDYRRGTLLRLASGVMDLQRAEGIIDKGLNAELVARLRQSLKLASWEDLESLRAKPAAGAFELLLMDAASSNDERRLAAYGLMASAPANVMPFLREDWVAAAPGIRWLTPLLLALYDRDSSGLSILLKDALPGGSLARGFVCEPDGWGRKAECATETPLEKQLSLPIGDSERRLRVRLPRRAREDAPFTPGMVSIAKSSDPGSIELFRLFEFVLMFDRRTGKLSAHPMG